MAFTSQRVVSIDEAKAKRLMDNLANLPKVIDRLSFESVRDLGLAAESIAKANHPYEDRTGNLTRSIGIAGPIREGGRNSVFVQALMEYAAPVEHGRKGPRRSRAYPFLRPAVLAVVRGSRGVQLLRSGMSVLRIQQGLSLRPEVESPIINDRRAVKRLPVKPSNRPRRG